MERFFSTIVLLILLFGHGVTSTAVDADYENDVLPRCTLRCDQRDFLSAAPWTLEKVEWGNGSGDIFQDHRVSREMLFLRNILVLR